MSDSTPIQLDLQSLTVKATELPFVSIFFGACLICLYYLGIKRNRQVYPPGPRAVPLLGNILDLSPENAWYKLTRYKDVYGELVFFHGLGNNVLVLNSMEAIHDLFDKRGAIYSDRPTFTVVSELMGLGQSMALMSYTDEWKAHRRLAHVALSPNAVKRYHVVQEDLAALLSQAFVDNPEDFFSQVRLTAARLILSLTYGLSVETADSEYICQAEDTMRIVTKATVPGAFLCDLMPWMKYLPSWLPFHKEALHGREMIDRMVSKPFDLVMRETEAGIAPPSFTHDLLSSENAQSANLRNQIKWVAGSMYGAGGETTYATVLTCILAMALHPEKLRRAQEELDRVVGMDRMPRVTDRTNLPYVDALVKETMRWHPVVPLGIARATSSEDAYRGYNIPKGTIVMPNVWAIAFSQQGPYDPYEFVPERFLVEDKDARPLDPSLYAFGFARRICPGRYLADNSIFILIATILAMFDIAPPEGEELVPAFTPALVRRPFKCKITPRSEAKVAQIASRAAQSTV
ncbi:cytochrome P450 [Trametes polyzona]|nr:cytochrome P450 [Trametes polyzona]